MEALYLFCSVGYASITTVVLSVCLALQSLLRCLCSSSNSRQPDTEGVVFYQGHVRHARLRPVFHSFQYPARYVLVDLDRAKNQDRPLPFLYSHLSADEARRIAQTSGPVWLLTIPPSVGYKQNPLSVYYCYNREGSTSRLTKCIAEVTNSPWGERVTFPFNPESDMVAKSLHVSPFMDMNGNWKMHATAPEEELLIDISVQHPEFGHFFYATLKAKKVGYYGALDQFFWLMPQKVAIWIYWQALKLWWKNVAFVSHPKSACPKYREDAVVRSRHLRCPSAAGQGDQSSLETSGNVTDDHCFMWKDAPWPWSS